MFDAYMKIRKASPDISAKGALALLRVQKKYADLCLDTSYHYYGKPVEIIYRDLQETVPLLWKLFLTIVLKPRGIGAKGLAQSSSCNDTQSMLEMEMFRYAVMGVKIITTILQKP